MSVDIGIIGLPKSGKTTVFDGLTGGRVASGIHKDAPFHIGMVHVPDPRLLKLSDMLHPQKVVPAEVRYIDTAASLREAVKDESISGQLLAQVSAVDALIHVVRAFPDDSVPHIKGSLDVDRDIAIMEMELTFSDLAIIERRQDRIDTSLKGAKPPERQSLLREQETLAKLKEDLEKGTPIRETHWLTDEHQLIANYQFLSAKPLLILINVGESQVSDAGSIEAGLRSKYSRPNCRLIALCGKLEAELAQLDENAAAEFRAGYGLKEAGLDRMIRLSYELLGLISFFTVASGEVRAWSIATGTDALRAAGKIHSDMERGFIRAEVVSFDDLERCGSLAEARKQGVLRLEGKSYVVQDGDVITFLFNV